MRQLNMLNIKHTTINGAEAEVGWGMGRVWARIGPPYLKVPALA
jgi:hypothetical protein